MLPGRMQELQPETGHELRLSAMYELCVIYASGVFPGICTRDPGA